MLVTPPIIDPTMKVFCPVCRWRGTLGQAKIVPEDLIRCPKCEYAVEKSNAV